MAYVDQTHLREVLTRYYSEGELRILCSDLGIDYESLGGRGKAENALELVNFAIRKGYYDAIVAYVRRTRPHVSLKMTDKPPVPPEAVERPFGSAIIQVQGDYLQGDKFGGDKVEGNKTTISNVSGGNVAVGDTFNMSGDFRGANVNIKSTLTHVNQTIGALPNADDDTKAQLQKLIAELNDALQNVPEDKAEDSEVVAEMAQELIEKANKEKPNKKMLQITGEGLKQAAKDIAEVVPSAFGIAAKIVALVTGLA